MLSLPSFYRAISRESTTEGIAVGIFLASFIPMGRRYGHPGIDMATESLARIVVQNAPDRATVGYLSRLDYGLLVPGMQLGQAKILVGEIQRAVDESNVEIHPGERLDLSIATGIVELGPEPMDHWRLIEEITRKATEDLATRYPSDWQYPLLAYPE